MMSRIPCPARFPGRLVLLGLLLTTGACAYYNTFFLAKKSFNAAEKSVSDYYLANPSAVAKVPSDAQRNYETAIRQSKKVLQKHSGSRWADDAIYVLGASYYGLGEYDSALISFGQLLESFPKSDFRAGAEFLVGMSRFKRHEYEQSEKQFETVLRDYPRFSRRDEILFTQAQTAEGMRREGEAIRRYETLVADFPKSPRVPESLERIGEIHFENGRYDSSLIAYRRLGDIAKDDRSAMAAAVKEARSLVQLGRADEALELIAEVEPPEAAVVQTPGSAQQQQQVRDEERNPGYDPATMTQEQLLRMQTLTPETPVRTGMDEEIAQLRLQKAAALNEAGRHKDAIETLRDITTRFANTNYAVEAQFQIGYTYETMLDSLEAARTAYERASGMSSRSIFRDQAASRSKALQSQLELEQRAGAEDTQEEERASSALRLAEILLLDRGLVDEAAVKYREVEEQFSASRAAPRAAYARAYIRWKFQGDSLGAHQALRDLVARYPASRQARGAIDLLVAHAADTSGLRSLLVALAPEPTEAEAPGQAAGEDSLGAPVDSLGVPIAVDSLNVPVDSLSGIDGRPGMSRIDRTRPQGDELIGNPARRRNVPGAPPDPFGIEPQPGPAIPDSEDVRGDERGERRPPPDAPERRNPNVPAPPDTSGGGVGPDSLRTRTPALADTAAADTSSGGQRP